MTGLIFLKKQIFVLGVFWLEVIISMIPTGYNRYWVSVVAADGLVLKPHGISSLNTETHLNIPQGGSSNIIDYYDQVTARTKASACFILTQVHEVYVGNTTQKMLEKFMIHRNGFE